MFFGVVLIKFYLLFLVKKVGRYLVVFLGILDFRILFGLIYVLMLKIVIVLFLVIVLLVSNVLFVCLLVILFVIMIC